MPTQDEVRERIYQTFVDGWGAASPYTFDNEDYDPAHGVDYVRVLVRFQGRTQQTLNSPGARKYLTVGEIIVQAFQPINTGTARSTILAQTAANLFEGKVLGPGVEDVFVYDAPVVDIGPDESGWHQVQARADFEFVEIR